MWRSMVSVLGLVLAAGCGGGSGGGSTGGGGIPPTTVTFSFIGSAPTTVAARIGSGAYEAQTLTSAELTLSIPNGTKDFAVAFVCPPWPQTVGGVQVGKLTEQTVVQKTVSDGTSFTWSCLPQPATGSTGTFTGSVDASALPGVSYMSIQAANATMMLGTNLNSLKSDFSFSAPAGSDRVEVLAYAQNPLGTSPVSSSLMAAKTYDSQVVPGVLNGGNPVGLGSADQTTAQPITYQNVPSGYAAPTTHVLFGMGEQAGAFIVADGATSAYPLLPAGAVRNGDSYSLIATAYQDSVLGLPIGPAVMVNTTSKTGGPMTFSFPAPWTYSGPVPAALPSFDLTYSGFAGNAGVNRQGGLARTTLNGGTNTNLFSVSTSASYQGGSTTIALPDLSGVSGFLPAPASGTTASWIAGVFQYDASTATGSAVESSGTYTVP
jgi:hypothetical protein